MSRRPVHPADVPPAVRAQADAAVRALADLPPRYAFVVVVTDTRDGDHTYYSDLTSDSAAIVLRDVSDFLTPSTSTMEN